MSNLKYDGSMTAAEAAKMFASGDARAIGADGKPESAPARKGRTRTTKTDEPRARRYVIEEEPRHDLRPLMAGVAIVAWYVAKIVMIGMGL